MVFLKKIKWLLIILILICGINKSYAYSVRYCKEGETINVSFLDMNDFEDFNGGIFEGIVGYVLEISSFTKDGVLINTKNDSQFFYSEKKDELPLSFNFKNPGFYKCVSTYKYMLGKGDGYVCQYDYVVNTYVICYPDNTVNQTTNVTGCEGVTKLSVSESSAAVFDFYWVSAASDGDHCLVTDRALIRRPLLRSTRTRTPNIGTGDEIFVSPSSATCYYPVIDVVSPWSRKALYIYENNYVAPTQIPIPSLSFSNGTEFCAGESTTITSDNATTCDVLKTKWYKKTVIIGGIKRWKIISDPENSITISEPGLYAAENYIGIRPYNKSEKIVFTITKHYPTPVTFIIPLEDKTLYTSSLFSDALILDMATPPGGEYTLEAGPEDAIYQVNGKYVFDAAKAGTGSHTITYTYTNKHGCTSTATQTVTVDPGAFNKTLTGYKMNNVLNAAATTYAVSGNQYTPYQTYTYAADRETDKSSDVDLKSDGVMNDVPMFDWKHPQLVSRSTSMEKWKKTNTITQRNNWGYETENRDILGNYSAALYGYSGGKAIAVARNARQQEIAFEGFEEHSQTQYPANGNLWFKMNYSTDKTPVSNEYEVLYGNGSSFIIDKRWDPAFTPEEILIHGIRNDGTNETFTFTTADIYTMNEATVTGDSDMDGKTMINTGRNDMTKNIMGIYEDLWSGKAIIRSDAYIHSTGYGHYNYDARITDAESHSGKKCMEIFGTDIYFSQGIVHLQQGKQYFFSAWVRSKALYDRHTYANDLNHTLIEFYDEDNQETGQYQIQASDYQGQKIEGWQKIECVFTVPPNTTYLQLHLGVEMIGVNPVTVPGQPLYFDDNKESNYFYIDDIRVHPFNANMKTYVYDPVTLRLTAELDENNYATLYSYDEQGRLYLVRKETKEGIKALQESHYHTREK